jgi:hypothetical protein
MRLRGFQLIVVVLMAVSVAGCGIIRRQEMQAKIASLKEQSNAAFQDCNTRFPAGNVATAVARAQCVNDAFAILRPIMPYPDLWDLYMASHTAIAERTQKGQLTIAQANEALAQKRSELVAEEQRRLLANRSVAAQENVAAASLQAAGPHSCTRYGATVTCF